MNPASKDTYAKEKPKVNQARNSSFCLLDCVKFPTHVIHLILPTEPFFQNITRVRVTEEILSRQHMGGIHHIPASRIAGAEHAYR